MELKTFRLNTTHIQVGKKLKGYRAHDDFYIEMKYIVTHETTHRELTSRKIRNGHTIL